MMNANELAKLNFEMNASLNLLYNLPLYAEVDHDCRCEYIAEKTGLQFGSFKLRAKVWNSLPHNRSAEAIQFRRDGHIPGSPEAIAAMRGYVASLGNRSFGEDDMEEGIDLGSGLDEFEREIELEEMEEAAELERGTVNLFKG